MTCPPSSLVDLRSLTQAELLDFVQHLGQPLFRGKQLLPWIYKPGVIPFAAMTDLAKDFRKLLAERATISRFEQRTIECSHDGAVKFGFALHDGQWIESVLIPEEDRNTLCLSSQVGCAMGCTFCLTGAMGFKRNLGVAEMINQVCAVRDWMLEQGMTNPLSNIVFMGMGEPLANLANLLKTISLLLEQRGLDFSQRRITVSTCGLIPQMLELGECTDVNLAVSLHAADNVTRSRLMPINDTYPVEALIRACCQYRQKKRKRMMIEYTLLAGVNDSETQARQLAQLLRPLRCKINLLAMNPVADASFCSPNREHILRFQEILRQQGYTVFIRQSRGEDISAACGQLATLRNKKMGLHIKAEPCCNPNNAPGA